MPRNPRKNAEGNFYHVMVQGIGKEHIFPDDDCKGYYLRCMQSTQEKYPAKIPAFCVMGNHAHALLSVENAAELSSYLRIVNSAYTSYYNRIHGRVGYVFRDRFRSELIVDERHLLYCLAYIQNNPLKAGMVKKAEDYNYSSYKNYLSGNGIVDFDEAKKYYEIKAETIAEIMQERTDVNWIGHEEEKRYECKEKVLGELKKKYGLKSGEKLKDMDTAALITREIMRRCGASIKEMAKKLGVGRETLRKRVVATPVP